MPSNYEKYFGSPEKAADTMRQLCDTTDCKDMSCYRCGIFRLCRATDELDWMERDADE